MKFGDLVGESLKISTLARQALSALLIGSIKRPSAFFAGTSCLRLLHQQYLAGILFK